MSSFTEGLHMELRSLGSPVIVQALCPGFTRSEFHDVLGVDRKSIPDWLWLDADHVVDASLRGLAQRKLYVIPGRFYRTVAPLIRRLPMGVRVALALRYAQQAKRISK
jgi:short-subunit dehydrogenase